MESVTAQYLKSIRGICPSVSDEVLSKFESKLTVKILKKKEFFLHSGKVQKTLGFITEGLVRSFYIDKNGNEITVGFYKEGDYVTHYPAFLMGKPSLYSIQCLEPTSMVCFTYEDQQWIYLQSAQFERYGRLIAEEILKRQQARIESFIFQTAEQRYLNFIEKNSSLFNRVSLSHLCSFLGIERQSLTRIRQKLSHQ